MTFNTSRRGFLRGVGGVAALGAAGCCSVRRAPIHDPSQKIKLAAVGVMGKGFSDWMPMLESGMVEMVAFCDADANAIQAAANAIAKKKKEGKLPEFLNNFDILKVPFFTDYRQLLDNCVKLGVEAMTISTPDHVHAPVAIQAMKLGIHVYVQKPLVRTLWELDYFDKTARRHGVITQMGNQGSSLNDLRRCTEVIQSGILGDVKEVHVWTNRPVWPQGEAVAKWVKGHPNGEPVRKGLNWDAWVATAKMRPFLDKYPADADVYDPWKLGKNVYHSFTWRGFFDFGCGAFGDMACHTMNLAFRGLELGGVSDAECIKIESKNDIAYPLKSKVKLTYKARDSKVQKCKDGKAKKLPPVTLYWYDGNDKPDAEIMPKWAATHGGKVPDTGCYMIGSKGAVLMQDDYGARCAIAMNEDKEFKDVFQHEAAKAVPRSIPFRTDSVKVAGKSTVQMSGFANGHYLEFVEAINGIGKPYEQTHSRCFADIEYSIPQMEGILVGCIAQQVPGKLNWCSASQKFDNAQANALVKPYIRDGFEF